MHSSSSKKNIESRKQSSKNNSILTTTHSISRLLTRGSVTSPQTSEKYSDEKEQNNPPTVFQIPHLKEKYFDPNLTEEELKKIADSKLINFSGITRLPSLLKTCLKCENFYYFTQKHTGPEKLSGSTWKLHITIHADDAAKVFDLIAPILYRFFYNFKCIDIHYSDLTRVFTPPEKMSEELRRTLEGRQFTIFLYEKQNGELLYNIDKLRDVIYLITSVLTSKNIRTGLVPESDLPINRYFGIRNDKDHLGLYLGSISVGKNHNPVNRPNPYQSLQDKKSEPFNPIKHYESLPKTFGALNTNQQKFMILRESLILTLYAMVFEYTNYQTFSDALRKGNDPFASPNPGLYFKTEYQHDKNIILKAESIMRLIKYIGDIRHLLFTQPPSKKVLLDEIELLHGYYKDNDSYKEMQLHFQHLDLNQIKSNYPDIVQLLKQCELDKKCIPSDGIKNQYQRV